MIVPTSLSRITFTALICCWASIVGAQSPAGSSSSSSSSSSGSVPSAAKPSAQAGASSSSTPVSPRAAQPEAGGAAITLEVNEPLFDLASALNACGYDSDLAKATPIREEVRKELEQSIAANPAAHKSRAALCTYIAGHRLNDPGRDLAQYVSLALYLSPPPALTPTVGQPEMPPDALQVINVLPLVRTFAEDVDLHLIWLHHRAEYQALLDRVHDPMTRMVLNTNRYLGLPVSSYDGRRFVVLLEPMIASSAANARIYANDFIIVSAPFATQNPSEIPVRMDQIRHTYLHYVVEPLVYARASATDRLLPLLKPVQAAPLEFSYKADIVALVAECLIKAIEDRFAYPGIDPPAKPKSRERGDFDRYAIDNAAYERQAETFRRALVERDVHQGWILVNYFYDRLPNEAHDQIDLKEAVGDMVYGMDVERERHRATQIKFDDTADGDILRRAPRVLGALDLAESDLAKGKLDDAGQIAEKALADPQANHARANYILARIDLLEQLPEDAVAHFEATLKTAADPRTLGWSHVYLGRLYDTQPDRPKALLEYRAALATPNLLPDTRIAAEKGLKEPFALPQHAGKKPDTEQEPDPTGKAEKESYQPRP